jgi:hypothetical protein
MNLLYKIMAFVMRFLHMHIMYFDSVHFVRVFTLPVHNTK